VSLEVNTGSLFQIPKDSWSFQGCILPIIISFLAKNYQLLLINYKMPYSHYYSLELSSESFSKQCCHLLIFSWKHTLKSFALWMNSILSKCLFQQYFLHESFSSLDGSGITCQRKILKITKFLVSGFVSKNYFKKELQIQHTKSFCKTYFF